MKLARPPLHAWIVLRPVWLIDAVGGAAAHW